MKILSPRGHAYIDYLVVIGFCAAPGVLELEGAPATVSYTLSGVHMVLTLTTDFPLGLVRLIPFPLHGILEFGVSILLIGMPWLLGFAGDDVARHFFIGAGASVLLAFLLTDYKGSGRA